MKIIFNPIQLLLGKLNTVNQVICYSSQYIRQRQLKIKQKGMFVNQHSVVALCKQKKGAIHNSAVGVVRCDYRNIFEANSTEEKRMPEGRIYFSFIIFT